MFIKIEQLSTIGGVKMAHKVVFIRVNLIVYPIDHISVIHTALDSIPQDRKRIVCIIQPYQQ
jgi:hypothetical protein